MNKSIICSVFFMILFFLNSCFAKAQTTISPETVTAFNNAGIPLLREKLDAVDFSLPLVGQSGTTTGTISLQELEGRVVFLNFWATWCPPCRAEMPSMEAMYNKLKEKGFEMLAVNIRESSRDVHNFMTGYNLTFPAPLDTDGRISAAYGVRAIPTTFIIDRDGKIISRITGALDWDSPQIIAAFELLLQ